MTETETKVARCTACRAEFTESELPGPEDPPSCPTCGSRGLPMAIADDVTIRINTHELRVLTIWASNWAEQCDRKNPNGHSQRSLSGILGALRAQLPGVPLTLGDELQQVADQSECTVTTNRGERFDPRKPD